MANEVIYIRPYRKTTIDKAELVHVRDVAEVYSTPSLKTKVEGLPLFKIPDPDKKAHYVITIMELIKLILVNCPNVDVENVGEMDMVIDYMPKPMKTNNFLEWVKVIIVSIIIFAGASIAIMTYNTDTSLPETFIILNRIITGEEVDNPVFITIPYSIGIAAGVIVFFNHIGKKKISDDPTPMQVEMDEYEKQVDESIVDNITDNRRGEP